MKLTFALGKLSRLVTALGLLVLASSNGFQVTAQAGETLSTNGQSDALSAVRSAIGQPAGNASSPQSAAPVEKASTNAAADAAKTAKNGSLNSMEALDDTHKLNIGDRLSFRIVEDEDDPKEIAVTVSGDMEVPYIGRYSVVGQTCKETAWKLKAELERKYYYHATVILAVNDWARSQGKVYIVGPVHAPGPQEIPSDEVLTVSKAILRAGGFGDYAERHKVEVRRKAAAPGGKDQVYTVDVAQILEKGKTDSDLPLEAGDVIYIPERLVRF